MLQKNIAHIARLIATTPKFAFSAQDKPEQK